ncbi:hypothetical protein ACIBQ6_36190 [Nonomuraea sp. NPDC049655]
MTLRRRAMPSGVPLAARLTLLAAVCAALLGLCALTWRWVEAPAQRLGRRLIRRAEPVPQKR